MSDTLLRALLADLVAPGDLVIYHGSLTGHHGLRIVQYCTCRYCISGLTTELRYQVRDPWDYANPLCPRHVRRVSFTPAAA